MVFEIEHINNIILMLITLFFGGVLFLLIIYVYMEILEFIQRIMEMNNKISLQDIYKSIRKFWTINPRTKIKDSNKKYNRKKSKRKFRKEIKDYLC